MWRNKFIFYSCFSIFELHRISGIRLMILYTLINQYHVTTSSLAHSSGFAL